MDVSKLIPDREAAIRIGRSVQTLQRWRRLGEGPNFFKIGKTVFYDPRDLEDWILSCRRRPEAA
jgi:hypothetical protein